METVSTEVNSQTLQDPFPDSYDIQAEFDYETLFRALTTLSSSFVDHEIGWVQFSFLGGNKVILTSVSHSYGIRHTFQANSYVGTGHIKVLGKQLYDYIKFLPKLPISFKIRGFSKLFVSCGKSVARVHLFQDPNISQLHPSKADNQLRIKGAHLERFVATFKDFVVHEDTRFFTRGALFKLEKKPDNTEDQHRLVVIATDITKLAHSTLEQDFSVDHTDFKNIIVPKKSLEELKRVSSANPEADFVIKWSSADHSFSCEMEDYLLYTMCLKGDYPPYDTAGPKADNYSAELDARQLQEAIRRTMLFADEKRNRALHLIFDKESLIVQGSTDNRESEDTMEIVSTFRSPFYVHYNASQFLSVIGATEGTRIQLLFENDKRPVKIVGEQPRGISVFYLLVPTRF